MYEHISLEHHGSVGLVKLDRPKMNVLNRQMQEEIREVSQSISKNADIRVVVFYGGEKSFAAGADIKEMVDWDAKVAAKQTPGLQACFTAVSEIPKPTIAAISGYALGGGLELALSCDLRIASSDSQLGQPEILLGVIPGAGGTQRLTRLIGTARAKDLIFTGRFVSATEALGLGLVNQVVEPQELLPRVLELAGQLAKGSATALAAAKAAIDFGIEQPLSAGLVTEQKLFSGLFGGVDQGIGMKSFIENGPGKANFS
jgi:enoyl-CoA hydratase